MADRTSYMRDYMKARRQRFKEKANKDSVNTANEPALTEERIRAIIREEIGRAMAPWQELLTQLTVNSVNTAIYPSEPGISPTVDYRRPNSALVPVTGRVSSPIRG